jgi:hypothetical protein
VKQGVRNKLEYDDPQGRQGSCEDEQAAPLFHRGHHFEVRGHFFVHSKLPSVPQGIKVGKRGEGCQHENGYADVALIEK